MDKQDINDLKTVLADYRHLKDYHDKREIDCVGNDDFATNVLNYLIHKYGEN